MGRAGSCPRERRSRRLSSGLRRPAAALSRFLPRPSRPRIPLAGRALLAGAAACLTGLSAIMLLLAAAPVQAQTAVKLVGNTGQTEAVSQGSLVSDHAQAFTTGNNATGYTLTKAQIRLRRTSVTTSPTYTVSIHSNSSSDRPGTSLGTLTNPSSLPTTASNVDFTTSGIDLSANTTYWLVYDVSAPNSSTGSIHLTDSDSADSGAAAGWSISSVGYFRSSGTTTWIRSSASRKIAIHGTVKSAGAPTVANAIPDQSVKKGMALSYAFPANTFSDPNDDTLTYTATQADGTALPTWLSFTASTRTFSGTAPSATGTVSVKVTASDGTESVSDTFDIAITNTAPTVANPIPDQVATKDVAFRYAFPANAFADADVGDSLTYTATQGDGGALPAWLTFAASTRTFSGTPTATGSVSVRVTASDGTASVSDTFDIAISTMPEISSVAIASRPRIDANNDGTKETYGAGQRIVVDVTWTTAVAWDVSASGAGIGVQLRIGGTTRRAELVTGGRASGTARTLRFAYTVAAGDSDTDGVEAVTASQSRLVVLRSGATLKKSDDDTVNAGVTHAGLGAQAGHLVAGSSAAPGNTAPTYSGTASDTGNAPAATIVGFNVAESDFSDPDGDPLTFTLSADRGPEVYSRLNYSVGRVWFKVRPNCVLATVSPALPSPFSTVVSYTATDPDGASAARTETYTTIWGGTCPSFSSAAVDGTALTITMNKDIRALNGTQPVPGADEFEVKVNGTAVALAASSPVAVSGKTVTLTLAAAVTPGQTVTVSYTPDAHSLASEEDDHAPMSVAFTDRAVTNNAAPTVANPIPDQSVSAGKPFSYQFPADTFSDADGDTLTYTATQGNGNALPPWLVFDASTRTFADPGAGVPGNTGTVSVKVTASDGIASVSDTFDLALVNAAPTVANPSRIRSRRWARRSATSFRRTRSTTRTVTIWSTRRSGAKAPICRRG